MECRKEIENPSNEEYFEVFDRNERIRYGFTSQKDRQLIEEKYHDKYVFKKYDYIDLEGLEDRSKIHLKLNFFEKIILILLIMLIISFIAGLISPEQYSSLRIAIN